MKCIAIDDEPLALAQIEKYIGQTPFLTLEGVYRSAFDAIDALASNGDADLIFADINMPDLNGIELVKSLGPGIMVIFTTAYSEYAVEGFRVDAQDYLLKPIGYPDFLRAAEKALRQYNLLKNTSGAATPQERLFVRSEYKIVPITIDDITYIESRGEYVRIYTEQNKPVMTLGSLRSYEEKLPRGKFMRIHRSYIVNMDKITAVERKQVIIADKRLSVGESYEKEFGEYISRNS